MVRFESRKIIFCVSCFSSSQSTLTWKNFMSHTQVRMQWYITMVALEDENLQRHGLVGIMFGPPNSSFPRISTKTHIIPEALPVRQVAWHLCLFGDALSPMTRYGLRVIGKFARQRLRLHLEGAIGTTAVSMYYHSITVGNELQTRPPFLSQKYCCCGFSFR